MIKLLLTVVVVLSLCFSAYLFFQARTSARQSPPVLTDGELPACPDKPNCVSSVVAPSDSHYIKPLSTNGLSMDALHSAIIADGGEIVQTSDDLLIATYKSALLGFTDDLLCLKSSDHIDVRSSSRVGYSDMGVNRKRIERLRAKLAE